MVKGTETARAQRTFVFERGDDQVEAVGVRAPRVGDVLERDKVGPCVDGADALTCVPARQVRLWWWY